MKKKFKFTRKNKKFLLSIVIVITLICIFMQIGSGIYARTNPQYYTEDSKFGDYISNLISNSLNIGVGVLTKPLSLLVNVVNILLFIILYGVALGSGVSNGLVFPFPDQIIFNGVAMLDPNFISPTLKDTAIINIVKDMIKNMYYSFFTLAATIFILAAVIIGIKLAFSAIAEEKAQYKSAIKYWLVGLITLFLMHFALSAMFTINEQICEAASKQCASVQITINAFDLVPVAGSVIKGVLNNISALFGQGDGATAWANFEVAGYGGLILKFLVKGVLQQDLIYSIGLSIILGQTFTLVIMYLKRVFYCVLLGMVAPLVVAVDTIQKVISGKDTGILKNWFQNMIAIIFNQSFQAIFLCISLIIIGKLSADGKNDMLMAILTIVTLNAIMKFDKLFKEMLGIKDSKIMGGFNENAMKSFAAIKSGMALAKRSAEPFKKRGEAKIRMNAAEQKRQKAMTKLSQLDPPSSPTASNTFNELTNQQPAIKPEDALPKKDLDENKEGKLNPDSAEELIRAMNELTQSMKKNSEIGENARRERFDERKERFDERKEKFNEKREKLQDELAEAETEKAQAAASKRAESLRAFTRFGTSVGSVAFGYGATGNLENGITVGNLVDVPMDKLTDHAVDRGVYSDSARRFSTAGVEDSITKKYQAAGMDQSAAQEAAKKAIKNINSKLSESIPMSFKDNTAEILNDALKGTADVVSKSNRNAAKNLRKQIKNASKIDDI